MAGPIFYQVLPAEPGWQVIMLCNDDDLASLAVLAWGITAYQNDDESWQDTSWHRVPITYDAGFDTDQSYVLRSPDGTYYGAGCDTFFDAKEARERLLAGRKAIEERNRRQGSKNWKLAKLRK